VFTIPLFDDAPMRRPAVMIWAIIIACALIFLWQIGLPLRAQRNIVYSLGVVPAVLFGEAELPARLRMVPGWASIFTSMFLHGGWLHVIGNMLYLWIFGGAVEDAMTRPRFLFFYLLCGTIAALAQSLAAPDSEVPMIGASGAIAGVLGAYFILFPRSNVVTFVWIVILVRLVALPGVVLLGLWFGLQVLSALAARPGEPGVAFWAHVGGFVAGMVLVMFFRRRGIPAFQPSRSRAYSVSRPGPLRRRGPWG